MAVINSMLVTISQPQTLSTDYSRKSKSSSSWRWWATYNWL